MSKRVRKGTGAYIIKLKGIREARGISVPHLSRLSGVPVRTIEDLEQYNECMYSTALKLCAALKIQLSEFVEVIPCPSEAK